MLSVEPLSPSFGAVVATDMLTILSSLDTYRSPLNKAFNRYGLLLWHNQTLTPDQELVFMKLLPWNPSAPPEKLYGPLGVPGADGDHYRRWRLPERPEILCQVRERTPGIV